MSPLQIGWLLLLLAGAALARSGRVLNGEAAAVGSHPYSVSLQRNGAHLCGGALISDKVVLTAAHCVTGGGIESYPPRTFMVRVGSIQRIAGGQLAQVGNIIVHKEYANGLNDLALVVLQHPITYDDNTKFITLASEAPPTGTELTFTGWGSVKHQAALNHRMMVGSRKTISGEACQKELFVDTTGLLCLASAAENIADGICVGDAGAPAVYGFELVGIASFYADICGGELPNGFTNVVHYLDWINENMSYIYST